MWSWAQAAFLCLLVITVELCHGRDFISSWYFCMKNMWVFEHSRKSEPPSQGVFTQSSKTFTSSDILIYLGTWRLSQAVSPFLSSVLLKEADVAEEFRSLEGRTWTRRTSPSRENVLPDFLLLIANEIKSQLGGPCDASAAGLIPCWIIWLQQV